MTDVMQFITAPFFYLIAIPAVLFVGIAKGGFAGTLGTITVRGTRVQNSIPVPLYSGCEDDP